MESDGGIYRGRVRLGDKSGPRGLQAARGEWLLVRTWVDEIRVQFEIARRHSGKLAASGYCDYTMIGLETGRAQAIPDWIVGKYAI